MDPPLEYAVTDDGVRLATFAFGDGPPLLITATPPWSHIQQEALIPAVSAWQLDLARTFRVVRYDSRGTGLSDREPVDFSVDAQVRDLEAIVHHHRLDSFAIWGSIGGSPAAMVYAARQPRRVSHLFLWGAYARGSAVLSGPRSSGLGALLRENWHVYTDTYAQIAFGWPHSDTASKYAELMRAAISHEAMLIAVRQIGAIDVTEEARAIRIPTLVMTRRGATISGVDAARELAALIPSAQLQILEGSSHAPFLENPDLVSAAIRAFIASSPASRPAATPPVRLTERETDVLRLLANGHTGKEIAATLGVSLATAQRHIANIYKKIGARGRVEAAAYAFEHGLARKGSG